LSAIKSSAYRELGPLCVANGHQDGVRDLAFLYGKDILVSVSEDSTMKLWNVKSQSEQSCLGTIRGHTGAIFALTQG
jgi:WD40 repeat protein